MQFSFFSPTNSLNDESGWLGVGQIDFYATDEIFRSWEVVTCTKI
jgi:hypothetical protein